jgi:phosphatidylglycerophosphatase A
MRAILTVGGIGLLRPAPGTWGSAVALAVGVVIDRYLGMPILAALTVAVTLLGIYACQKTLLPGQDPSEVVIDEVAGQWIALLFPSAAFWFRGHEGFLPWPAYVSAFVFFRLFDIWKPWVIGRADSRGDAAGVMLDDLWAGLFAGVAVMVAGAAYHLVFVF